jgi:hypothetical protein
LGDQFEATFQLPPAALVQEMSAPLVWFPKISPITTDHARSVVGAEVYCAVDVPFIRSAFPRQRFDSSETIPSGFT